VAFTVLFSEEFKDWFDEQDKPLQRIEKGGRG
jgi:hypothetical protein